MTMANRSMWSGTLAMGAVVIPVGLAKASGDEKEPIHQVRRSDGSRLQYRRFAVADGREVPYAEVGSGYELPDGSIVQLSKDELDVAFGGPDKQAKIITFTSKPVPGAAFEATYYVMPEKGGHEAYALLAEALKRSGKVGVVSIALRNKRDIALLTEDDGKLILERLYWPSEVRSPDFDVKAHVDEKQLDLLENFMSLHTDKDWSWEDQVNPASAALEALVQAKIGTGQVVRPPVTETPTATPAIDLTAVLTQSVAQARKDKALTQAARTRPSRKAAAAA